MNSYTPLLLYFMNTEYYTNTLILLFKNTNYNSKMINNNSNSHLRGCMLSSSCRTHRAHSTDADGKDPCLRDKN